MAYRANPFLERVAEQTSDQDFISLFSPKILERLPEDVFDGAVHIFRSPPGGGKTTLLRAFTPTVVRAFWSAQHVPEMREAVQRLEERGVLHSDDGPQMLGVLLSCAAGYADLPPGASLEQAGLFRALLDCRVVLRTLRNLVSYLGFASVDSLDTIQLDYGDMGRDLKSIPLLSSAGELIRWAEERERAVYDQLDTIARPKRKNLPAHVRFESVLWLQSVRFIKEGRAIAPRRLLMIDDLHRLRRKQRALLIEELAELRPNIPVWLAERSITMRDELLSQGVRQGRDVKPHSLDELWGPRGQNQQFFNHAQTILDRRLERQSEIPKASLAQYLRGQFAPDELRAEVDRGIELFRTSTDRHRSNVHYAEWLARAAQLINKADIESLIELYTTRILIARNEAKRQLALDLTPIPTEELEERDSSQVKGAAEIFLHEEVEIPYYFGIERLCVMASNNVEELLALAAALYEGIQAKQVLRKPELVLSPREQEKLLKDVAKRKYNFIPKTHMEGTRAQRLLDAIGTFCRNKTFLASAPYAAGVTGVRLSKGELATLHNERSQLGERVVTLRKVLGECVAENLLMARFSSASTARDSGTILYLNRTLCAHYGLPLQMGGWQDVEVTELVEWMDYAAPDRHKRLGVD